jgi:cupin 2 domain-containing protein
MKTHFPENVFQGLPKDLSQEVIDIIAQSDQIRIERIVSQGHKTPPDYWYDQDEHEFVLVLQGKAGLIFAEEEFLYELAPGDYIVIPARKRHRVEWTVPDEITIWLTVYFSGHNCQDQKYI